SGAEDIPRLLGRRLRHHRATVGLDGDHLLQGQALQRGLHMVAVGVQGFDDLRFDQPCAGRQAVLGNGLVQRIDDALNL
nr:hypothetical protein [Tanacetum cinerariifolium]